MDQIQHRTLSLLQGSDSFAYDARVAHLEQRAVDAVGATPAPPRAAVRQPGVANVRTDLDVVLFSSVLDTVLDLHDENIGYWLRLRRLPRRCLAHVQEGIGRASLL